MFRQENSGLTVAPDAPNQPNNPVSGGKKSRKKLYAMLAGAITIAIIAGALFIAQGSASQIQLSLNYTVGERMVYYTTNVITNQQFNTSINVGGTPSSESYFTYQANN